MVAGGISFEPSRAVNAHAVQQSADAIEHQNQLVRKVRDIARAIPADAA